MRTLSAAVLFLLSIGGALAGTTPAPEGAKVYIVEPKNGALVQSPVKVVFGATGIGVAPAGTQKENTGHHHLLIDTGLPPLDQPIPSDATHKHFGGGQTEVLIELTPGQHTLQLLLADFAHIPHNPPLASEPITITVK